MHIHRRRVNNGIGSGGDLGHSDDLGEGARTAPSLGPHPFLVRAARARAHAKIRYERFFWHQNQI